jgi:hypothetical protein
MDFHKSGPSFEFEASTLNCNESCRCPELSVQSKTPTRLVILDMEHNFTKATNRLRVAGDLEHGSRYRLNSIRHRVPSSPLERSALGPCVSRRARSASTATNLGQSTTTGVSPSAEKASEARNLYVRGFESGWRDLNPRPLDPQSSALTKLRYSP